MAAKKKPPAPPPLAGTFDARGGVYSIRVRIDGQRKRIRIGLASEMTEARARETAAAWLERMAAEGIGAAPTTPAGATVAAHFDAWISGDMFREHGAVNGLKIKASADVDGWRVRRYVYPLIGPKLVADVTEEDIERILARIPAARSAGTRIKIHALLHRGFDLAIVPGRLRKDNPVTRYHKPAKAPPKLFAYLFPAELLTLLACRSVPLGRRVLYALATYTGLRKSSVLSILWRGVDVANRTIVSKVSKTGIAQHFEIPPGLAWVLARWRIFCGSPAGEVPIIPLDVLELQRGGQRAGRKPRADLPRTEAAALRADLRAAGITRELLFDDGPNVEPLRFHDLRATFTTWAKRAGKGDGWIQDRTGHQGPAMVARYTRAARTLEDLRLDPFPDLTGTIPELVDIDGAAPQGSGGAAPEGPATPPTSTPPTTDPSGPTARTFADLDASERGDPSWQITRKARTMRRNAPPCGSRCRGFKPRYSPQAQTPGHVDESNDAGRRGRRARAPEPQASPDPAPDPTQRVAPPRREPDMSIDVLEDFVSRQYQEDVSSTLLSANFPWFLNQRTLPDGYPLLGVPADGAIVDTPQFTHTLHEAGAPASTFFGLVMPILHFFTAKTGIATNRVIRVKANLTCPNPRTLGNVYQGPHVDYELPDGARFLTLIYYVNDSDGDTVLFHERATAPVTRLSERMRVTPKQGKLVYFAGDIIHTGQNPTVTPARAVINLNVRL
jgi:integrase